MYVCNGPLSMHRARVSTRHVASPTVYELAATPTPEISLRADCDRSITRQPRSFATERERNWDVKSRDFNRLCACHHTPVPQKRRNIRPANLFMRRAI